VVDLRGGMVQVLRAGAGNEALLDTMPKTQA
jgi:hypothetical protein